MATTAQAIVWRHDYEGALDDAQRQGKLMLLDFRCETAALGCVLAEKASIWQ